VVSAVDPLLSLISVFETGAATFLSSSSSFRGSDISWIFLCEAVNDDGSDYVTTGMK
jgi:hypothetical protein